MFILASSHLPQLANSVRTITGFLPIMRPLSGIPEITVDIFQNCDSIREVLALASTCRFLDSVFHDPKIDKHPCLL